jgi:hypothetical protein
VLLSSSTAAAPTFTPALQGGAWTAICVVTDGQGESARAVQRVTIGDKGFVQLFAVTSDGSTDTAPSGGTLSYGGKTWTVIADADSGPRVDDGDLVITPPGASQASGTSLGTAGGLRIALSALHADLSAMGTRDVLVLVEVRSYAPSTSEEGFVIAREVAGAGLGSGSGGRAAGCGQGVSGGTIRAGRCVGQASALFRSVYTTQTTAAVASFAALLGVSEAVPFSTNVADTFALPSNVVNATPRQSGGSEAATTYTERGQILIYAQKPFVGVNGSQLRIRKLSVWVRG